MKANRSVSVSLSAALVVIAAGAAPLSAQAPSQLSNKGIVVPQQLKVPANSDRSLLRQVSTATMTVKQIEAKLTDFPQTTANQYKVAFECSITATPAQTDYSKFPRYSCIIDQAKTSSLNGLPISRVDRFPAADGVLTRVVMVADKSAKNPNPGRIRTAFQLIHEKSASASEPVQKDFTYVDALLK